MSDKKEKSGFSGAQLTKALRESGTGQAKLDVCRAFLASKPKCTAEELLVHLTVGGPDKTQLVPDGTLAKCRNYLANGEVTAPEASKQTFIEDDILVQTAIVK